MEAMVTDLSFWKNKRVFLTGHTGFKGAWLSFLLIKAGANLNGYALMPDNPSLFNICALNQHLKSTIADIRDYSALARSFKQANPEIVIHMAAQPLVRESYQRPAYTYDVNVMGTVNILECLRQHQGVRSFVNVTTDKVYHNHEWHWGYRETDALNGFDPYSNSKSCAELVTESYGKSFLQAAGIAVSTARAGNVIGGGDFAKDRIIPDCVRAAQQNKDIIVRNPHSIRPYQHVLEPLFAYLLIARKQYQDIKCAGCYNVGPDDKNCVTTADLAACFCQAWGNNLGWQSSQNDGPHEASFLKLDCSKIKARLNWRPIWDIKSAVAKVVEWHKGYFNNDNMENLTNRQIDAYLADYCGNSELL